MYKCTSVQVCALLNFGKEGDNTRKISLKWFLGNNKFLHFALAIQNRRGWHNDIKYNNQVHFFDAILQKQKYMQTGMVPSG